MAQRLPLVRLVALVQSEPDCRFGSLGALSSLMTSANCPRDKIPPPSSHSPAQDIYKASAAAASHSSANDMAKKSGTKPPAANTPAAGLVKWMKRLVFAFFFYSVCSLLDRVKVRVSFARILHAMLK